MTRQQAIATAVACSLAGTLYLLPLSTRGLIGPDEPRYAAIALHMAESGDWITPTLWDEPWFEKPALLFWLGAVGHALGLEAYTRVPVALLNLAFLGFFYWRVRNSFDRSTANMATSIVATSAGWVAYADAGVFDAPVTVFTSAAVLCLLPGADGRDNRSKLRIAGFGALLGLGVLSKGLVAPIVAMFPTASVVLGHRQRVSGVVWALVPFLAVCLPWYFACYGRNGRIFFDEFIVRHHLERFVSSSLQHVQPWWFYAPVLVVFLLPWTPLLFGLNMKSLWRDPSQRFLACWAFGPLVFFSLSVNKLPSYILPALPPLAILLAVQWNARPRSRLLLASAGTLVLVPLTAAILPQALADGVTRAFADLPVGNIYSGILSGVALMLAAGFAALRSAGPRAIPAVGCVVALGLAFLKLHAYPAISRAAGVREFLAEHQAIIPEACIGTVRRHTDYGLRHYGREAIPSCAETARPLRIEGDPPRVVSNRQAEADPPDNERSELGIPPYGMPVAPEMPIAHRTATAGKKGLEVGG